MPGPTEICPKCRKPAASTGGGSITQWIAVCRCNEPPEPHTEQRESSAICLHCGKHISAGRHGSLTQYIFRHDLCSCEKPVPGSRKNEEAEKGGDSTAEQIELPEEIELPLEADKFPLDRYKPLSLLGRGAAGAVYLCRDRLLGKKVAVKTLNELTGEQLVAFQLEAKATSKLKHPSIVAVMDFGATESGRPFMVMEYVRGTSLAEYLDEIGVLDADQALTICSRVANALSYVHEHEMFHRDLKPSNVLLVNPDSENFEVRLIDFGVAQAKFNTQEPTLFQGRTVVGTPNYMSPDQAMGLAYDERSEVYSLGCMLFELLTGRPPFVSNTALETLSMHAHEPPPTLSEITDIEYPPHVEALVAKCLEKNPDDRFQSMEQMQEFLINEAPFVVAHGEGAAVKGSFKGLLTLAIVAIVIVGLSAVAFLKLADQHTPVKKLKPARTGDLDIASGAIDGGKDIFLSGVSHFKVVNKCAYLEGDVRMLDLKKIADEYPELEAVDASKADSIDWRGFRFFKNSNIVRVLAADTDLQDKDLEWLGYLPRLDLLSIQATNVEGNGLKYLANSNISYINLCSTRVTRQSFVDLSKMKRLVRIGLQSTAGWSGKDIEPLRGKDIQMVIVSMTRCGDGGAEIISSWPRLQSLMAEDCGLTDKGLKAISKLEHLDFLNVHQNKALTKKAIMSLASMRALRKLYVDEACLDQTGILAMQRKNPNLEIKLTKLTNFGD